MQRITGTILGWLTKSQTQSQRGQGLPHPAAAQGTGFKQTVAALGNVLGPSPLYHGVKSRTPDRRSEHRKAGLGLAACW